MTDSSMQSVLMEALVDGDVQAFERIYDLLSVLTYEICRHHLDSEAAADEAMHGLWLYIWQNAAMLSSYGDSPWAIITATAEHHAQFHATTERIARTAVS